MSHTLGPVTNRARRALLDPLHRWAIAAASPVIVPVGRTGGQTGAADVEDIRAVTAMYRDIDTRHGGAISREAVVTQLNDAVSLLDTCTYAEATGHALLSAVADLGSVAGWMSFDAGHHSSAQELFITSLHAATEADDKALGAHILQCVARQMSHLEQYEDALALVDLLQYGARRQPAVAPPAAVSRGHPRAPRSAAAGQDSGQSPLLEVNEVIHQLAPPVDLVDQDNPDKVVAPLTTLSPKLGGL
ncbi:MULTISPECIES: hypothetical protein [unclassified Streptomyces]|uniref:hypothetical protein n=1 Tax=unclassified Streptomyces TaxID=2593676 RepID=UPI0035E340F1